MTTESRPSASTRTEPTVATQTAPRSWWEQVQHRDHVDTRYPTDWEANSAESPVTRRRGARSRRLGVVTKLFASAGVAFPPRQMLLRGFKQEKTLEVWAAGTTNGPLTKIATYKICYASGKLGPKRREGDFQTPEGFYRIAYFNPRSRFHLSMLVSYPNRSDALFGKRGNLGGEIMIHGNCVSVGCLAMSDERMEELWLMGRSLRGRVHVHLYPTRYMKELLASGQQPEHHRFWKNLQEGLLHFERYKKLPQVDIASDGLYRFR